MRAAILRASVCIGLLMLPAVYADAAIINVGTHDLLPNTAGQVIQISVSGVELVIGANVRVQVGSGGGYTDPISLVVLPPNAPIIQSMDILTGTIFAGNNTGQVNAPAEPQFWDSRTTTNSGSVLANGLVLTALIDTTGFISGQWALRMSDVLSESIGPGFNTELIDAVSGQPITTLQINDGLLRIQQQPGGEVPEPSALAIWGLLGIAGCFGARRLRRQAA